jgi:Rps23 Pro-64 3,4-dihydroxylase Tpa1-like proline 4-hydroxylase
METTASTVAQTRHASLTHFRLSMHRWPGGIIPAFRMSVTRTSDDPLTQEIAALRRSVDRRDKLLAAHAAPVFTAESLKRFLKRHRDEYRGASPFPHVAIDKFLEPDILRRVADEFVAMDRASWHSTANPLERKLSNEHEAAFGPVTRRVFSALNSSEFLTFLEQLTGIEGLIADPHLRGGGLHEIKRGGLLGVHADFNHYKRLNIWRRLNLLVYLNTAWEDSWGGQLELWDRDGTACVKQITPTFNRAVIFDTSNRSYHGHPHPLNCPEEESRKSLALYYYTVDYPYDDDRTPHSTAFLQATPKAG